MSQIDRYILNELFEVDAIAREGYNAYSFSRGSLQAFLTPHR